MGSLPDQKNVVEGFEVSDGALVQASGRSDTFVDLLPEVQN